MLRPRFSALFSIALLLVAAGGRADVAQRDLTFVGTEKTQNEILASIAKATPVQFKPLGDATFRMRLSPPPKTLFKPRTRERLRGCQSELAAYRVARLLGLDNVPPAVSKTVQRSDLRRLLHPAHTKRWRAVRRSLAWDDDAAVLGAAIFWVDETREFDLDTGRARWLPWLSEGGSLPDGRELLARDLSTMILFDFLIANSERYAGGNMRGLPSGERIFLQNQHLSFAAPLSPKVLSRLKSDLSRVERFSRSVVERLTALDEPTLRAELAKDPGFVGTSMLTDLQVADFLDRRATALSHIAALVEERGARKVLVFE